MIVNGTYFTKLKNNNGEDFSITEEEMAKAFATCLKELRKYKGYTLKQVAENTGIPFQTVARYENGENTPSIVQAFKFSNFYKLDLYDMLLAGYDEEWREKVFEESTQNTPK